MMLFKSKKGTFFHWLLLGVLAAVAITLLLVSKGLPGTLIKGDWQLDFLQQSYLEAEKELLRTEVIATNIGRDISFSLAQRGGFDPGEVSPCGEVLGVNLWNKGAQSCFPDIMKNARNMAIRELAQELPRDSFSELGFLNGTFFGKGNAVQINSANSKYTFNNHFAVSLDYYFEDYPILYAEAQRMISSCRDRSDLRECLDTVKPSYWKFGSCSAESFPENSRIVPFCAQSPLHSTFSLGTELAPISVDAVYLFALDFSSSAPLSAQDLTINWNKETSQFTLHFSRDLLAQKYAVYVTNYPLPLTSTGTAQEVFGNVLEDFEFFKDSHQFRDQDLVLDPTACTSDALRQPLTPYLCGEEIIYELIDASGRFKEHESYELAVTTFWGEAESRIKELFLITT